MYALNSTDRQLTRRRLGEGPSAISVSWLSGCGPRVGGKRDCRAKRGETFCLLVLVGPWRDDADVCLEGLSGEAR